MNTQKNKVTSKEKETTYKALEKGNKKLKGPNRPST
ncbi:acid-soluble spore protein SspM [Virgibacillus sp. MG-45]